MTALIGSHTFDNSLLLQFLNMIFHPIFCDAV